MAINNAASAKYMNGMDQSAHRGHAIWFDQHRHPTFTDASGNRIFEHGRPYYSVIELRSGQPTGPVLPLGWTAPFIAPQQYIKRSIGKIAKVAMTDGLPAIASQNTDRFRIDYAAMKRDDDEATAAHWRLAVQTAIQYGFEAPRPGRPMDPRLLTIVGPAPRDPRIAQALLAGNPWILGQLAPTYNATTGRMEVEEDEQLARILKLNRSDMMTYEQALATDEAPVALTQPDVLAEMKALLAQVQAEKRELEALRADAPKRGRPRKSPAPAEV